MSIFDMITEMYVRDTEETVKPKYVCPICEESYCETKEEIRNKMCYSCEEFNPSKDQYELLKEMRGMKKGILKMLK